MLGLRGLAQEVEDGGGDGAAVAHSQDDGGDRLGAIPAAVGNEVIVDGLDALDCVLIQLSLVELVVAVPLLAPQGF